MLVTKYARRATRLSILPPLPPDLASWGLARLGLTSTLKLKQIDFFGAVMLRHAGEAGSTVTPLYSRMGWPALAGRDIIINNIIVIIIVAHH